MRGMAWVQPVPTALNTTQWATQNTAARTREIILLYNGRLLLDGMGEWADDAPVTAGEPRQVEHRFVICRALRQYEQPVYLCAVRLWDGSHRSALLHYRAQAARAAPLQRGLRRRGRLEQARRP